MESTRLEKVEKLEALKKDLATQIVSCFKDLVIIMSGSI